MHSLNPEYSHLQLSNAPTLSNGTYSGLGTVLRSILTQTDGYYNTKLILFYLSNILHNTRWSVLLAARTTNSSFQQRMRACIWCLDSVDSRAGMLSCSGEKALMSMVSIVHYKILFHIKKRIEHIFSQYYHKKRVGFRSVNVSTFIYKFTKYWIELCSKTLSVVQEARIFWPHCAIRWHHLTILSTDTISAFLGAWHVEHVTEWSPVLGSDTPSWVNHLT